MFGKMILFGIILFAAYWAREFYMQGKKAKKKRTEAHSEDAISESKVDDLIADFNQKIKDIESQSLEKIKASEDRLKYYKEEIEKLNKIKNQ